MAEAAPRALILLLAACGPRPAPEGVVPPDSAISGARYQNAHLLAGDVGRGLIGRFVDPELWPIDASSVRETACSGVIRADRAEPAEVDGVYSGTVAAAARLGLPKDGESVAAWLDHDASAPLVAVVEPDALRACCAEQPDACDAAFVGEVITGQARVYRPDGAPPQWVRAGRVDGDLAFRLTGNPFVGPDCGLWRQHPPRAATGTWLLGVSNATFTEVNARTDALQRVRQQATTILREQGRSESAVARLREDRWCVESFPGAGGTQHVAYLLAWLPTE